MTDFNNGFDPSKHFSGAQFNTGKHGKNTPPQQQPSGSEQTANDPYAGQRLSADEIFGLMNTQAQFAKAGVDHGSIFENIAAFESAISPEEHSKMMKDVESAFQDEFGISPSSTLVEMVVSDHLIGKPAIQAF